MIFKQTPKRKTSLPAGTGLIVLSLRPAHVTCLPTNFSSVASLRDFGLWQWSRIPVLEEAMFLLATVSLYSTTMAGRTTVGLWFVT